ncbi:protein of unknown function [Candidatus Promineifilum breve]|uniref:Uncharacterized protein n=1 Tax=Candidatus Promineifilum breve TaxID=1806508 RepID=A0A160T681_9CHLR|nr:protein of unknown function [Candidatus Promineifilum breve]
MRRLFCCPQSYPNPVAFLLSEYISKLVYQTLDILAQTHYTMSIS